MAMDTAGMEVTEEVWNLEVVTPMAEVVTPCMTEDHPTQEQEVEKWEVLDQ